MYYNYFLHRFTSKDETSFSCIFLYIFRKLFQREFDCFLNQQIYAWKLTMLINVNITFSSHYFGWFPCLEKGTKQRWITSVMNQQQELWSTAKCSVVDLTRPLGRILDIDAISQTLISHRYIQSNLVWYWPMRSASPSVEISSLVK